MQNIKKKAARLVIILVIIVIICSILFSNIGLISNNIFINLSNLTSIETAPFQYSISDIQAPIHYNNTGSSIALGNNEIYFSNPYFLHLTYSYSFDGKIKQSSKSDITLANLLSLSIEDKTIYVEDTSEDFFGELYRNFIYENNVTGEKTVLNKYYKLDTLYYNNLGVFDIEITDPNAKINDKESLLSFDSIDFRNEMPLLKTVYFYDFEAMHKKELFTAHYLSIYPIENELIIAEKSNSSNIICLKFLNLQTLKTKDIVYLGFDEISIVFADDNNIYCIDGNNSFLKINIENGETETIKDNIKPYNIVNNILYFKEQDTNKIFSYEFSSKIYKELFKPNSIKYDIAVVGSNKIFVLEKIESPLNSPKIVTYWYDNGTIIPVVESFGATLIKTDEK